MDKEQNRVIKFRAWDGGMHYKLSFIGNGDENGNAVMGEHRPLINPILMQFTGLHDKSGKEIYEGDIVRILYTDWPSQTGNALSLEDYKKSISYHGVVEWHDAGWHVKMWGKKYQEYYFDSIDPGRHGEIEVIGSIYSTPNLIKK